MSKLKFQFGGSTFLTFQNANGSNLFYKIIHSILRLADKLEILVSILFVLQIIVYSIFWPRDLTLVMPLGYIFTMLVIHFVKYFYRLKTPIKTFKLDIALIFFVTLATLASLIPYFISIYSGNGNGSNNFIVNNKLNLGINSSFSYIILLFSSYFLITSLIDYISKNRYFNTFLVLLLTGTSIFFFEFGEFNLFDLVISLFLIFILVTFTKIKNVKELIQKIYKKITTAKSSLKINNFDIFYIVLVIVIDIILIGLLIAANFGFINAEDSILIAAMTELSSRILDSSAYELIFGGQNVRNSDAFLLGFFKNYGLIITTFFVSLKLIVLSKLISLFETSAIKQRIEILLLAIALLFNLISMIVFDFSIQLLILFWIIFSISLVYISAEDKNYLDQDKYDITELKKWKRWKLIETLRIIVAFILFPILLSWGYNSLLMLT